MIKKENYRADIDGLRAIAVLLVIFFHANFQAFSGGYIGVDVFFVISGFLITSSIDKELSTGNFSFKNFYLRRIRRIIPVLVFVIICVTVFAYFILFTDDFERYSRTVIHTMLSTNNFHLWGEVNNYFVENTELMPLLHTWSLSVEEQFYFIWPIILLLIHRFFKLKQRLFIIVLFVLMSIFLSIYLTNINRSMAYFLLPARLFELALGGGLAMFWSRIPELDKKINDVLSVLGILLILIPSITLTKNSLFPGLNAFWPCLGATLIILSGKNNNSKGLGNKILEIKYLVFLGLLSYSMYLWHWPVLVFIKYLGYEISYQITVIALSLIILISYFSWRFVEKPFRYRFKFNFYKTLLFVLLPCLSVTGAIYGIIDAKDGFPKRFPNLTEFNKKINDPGTVRKRCYNSLKIGNYNECGLGVVKKELDGILIGDSFANHSAFFIDVLARDANMYFHDSSASWYPLLGNVSILGNSMTNYGNKRLELAKEFKTVCLASFWGAIDEKSKVYEDIISSVEELIALKKNIIVIDHLGMTNITNLHRMKLNKTNIGKHFSEEELLVPFRKRSEDYIVYQLKKKFPSIIVIDLNDVMCEGDKCNYTINGQIVYKDFSHLNISGAKSIAYKYLKEKGNPLDLIK